MHWLRLQIVISVGLSCVGGVSFWAQSAGEINGDPVVYMFIGGELIVAQGKGYFPVSTMSKRHIFVDQGTGTKKVSKNSSMLLKLQSTVSSSLVEISNLDMAYISTLPSRIEAQAISDMLRHQMGTEQEIAILEKLRIGGGRTRLNYDVIEEMKRETQEYQEGLRDHSKLASDDAEDKFDTLHLQFDLLPEEDYNDAYIAVAVSFELSRQSGSKSGSQVVAEYIGKLQAGRVETVKFRRSLKTFFERGSKCEIFLFHGEGEQIATNLSRRLQPLDSEQYQVLLEKIGGS
jgi:hypothetical protein